MKIALAQFNPIVGDITRNVETMGDMIRRAADAGADLVVFSELSVIGYPPRDLLAKERFVADNVSAVEELAAACRDVTALVGFARPTPTAGGRPLQNAAAVLAEGEIRHVHVKALLPTYDVFDETRYFEPGESSGCFEIGGERIGLSICEDLWDAEALGRALYGEDPIARLAAGNPRVIINMAASPYEIGKPAKREALFRRQARRHHTPIVYVNQVGGNDELVFDGGSCLVSADGEIVARCRRFDEDLLVADLDGPPARCEPTGEELANLSAALKLGLRDFVHKCGLKRVALGLSGGIDSAVVAVLAADALGPENVHVLLMPSRYSSEHSLSDAELLARNLGVHSHTVGIEPMHAAFDDVCRERLADGNWEIAEENIQARIRGTLVMAWSNALGLMPMATGNKSELSVGYCTLYGDMAGGLAPIGDVLKTVAYRLADQLNAEAGSDRIPGSILTKAPSVELKPGQFDQDKLPPYDVLDEILTRYIVRETPAERIVAEGFDPDIVRRVVRMVDGTEYKRKQAAPVLKVTARAFGTGRRMPIAQRYLPADLSE